MLDPNTERAARSFLHRIKDRYEVVGALLYGSRARGDHRPDSDTDLAVIVRGRRGAQLPNVWELGAISTDVLLDTGVFIQALAIWHDDWEHPERFSNPYLIENIRRDGVPL